MKVTLFIYGDYYTRTVYIALPDTTPDDDILKAAKNYAKALHPPFVVDVYVGQKRVGEVVRENL